MVFWLPTIRGLMDGPDYEWSNFGFGGQGTGGDYWFPVVGSALSILAFWLGWRGGRFPVHAILMGWFGFLALGATWLSINEPDAIRFRGDTLGVDLTLTWLGPLFFGALALLAVVWAASDLVARGRNLPKGLVPPWSRRNTVLLGTALVILPLQALLLGTGPIHGPTDQVGVVLTLVQWFTLAVAFRPAPRSVDPRQAFGDRN